MKMLLQLGVHVYVEVGIELRSSVVAQGTDTFQRCIIVLCWQFVHVCSKSLKFHSHLCIPLAKIPIFMSCDYVLI